MAKSQFVEFVKQNSIPHKGEYYDKDYFGNYQNLEATRIYQEAYYKVYSYIDLNKEEKFNFKALSNQILLEEKEFYPSRLAEYNYKFGDMGLEEKDKKNIQIRGIKKMILKNACLAILSIIKLLSL